MSRKIICLLFDEETGDLLICKESSNIVYKMFHWDNVRSSSVFDQSLEKIFDKLRKARTKKFELMDRVISKKCIINFRGENYFLSNFWLVKIEYEGLEYPSVEHAFQAQKTLNQEIRLYVSKIEHPAEARVFMKRAELRPDWEKIKLKIMEDLIRQKFTRYLGLKQKLIETGDLELIEENNWNDTFWGVCNGIGENNLGKILMKIRDEVKKEVEL